MRSLLSGATVGYVTTAIMFTVTGQANVGTFLLGPPICIGWMIWAFARRQA